MTWLRGFVAACGVMLAASIIVAQDPPEVLDPQEQLQTLRQGILKLEAGEVDAARAMLEPVSKQGLPQSIVRHTAGLLHGQLSGAFEPRMATWADRKVVDAVVLVPDEASLLAAVQSWPADRFWPVLVEDGWFAPMFIDAFRPAAVLRWSEDDEDEATERGELPGLFAAAIQSHNEHYGKLENASGAPGLVVIDPYSPLRGAGFALAVGRGQPVLALRPESSHQKAAAHDEVRRLHTAIDSAMAALKLLRNDQWCAITLAGDFPYKFNEDDGKHNPLAVDDYLGRNHQGVRLAVAGRLLGSATQANYMAMCSMFLQPRSGLLVNAYNYNPERQDTFSRYSLAGPAEAFKPLMDIKLVERSDEQSDIYRGLTQPAMPFDFLWINSSNGSETLSMGGGGLRRVDMPLGEPFAVHMVASFSAADPWNERTLAAQCLAGGAYWYFGAVHEPYLESFMQSTAMAHRAAAGTPLSFAAKQPPGYPFYRPWKLMLVGDPLFSFQKRDEAAERVKADDVSGAKPLTPPGEDDRSLTRRFLHAVFTGSDERHALAAAVLADPMKVSADVLARAALDHYAADKVEQLAAMSEPVAKRHPALEMIVQRLKTPAADTAK